MIRLVDPDRREWLERLAESAQRALEELHRFDDPQHRDLLEDLEQLHERLTAELRHDS
jgi:histidinol-phosphate/aromatic aminotransferase/cobyric acid decarboxylase-like protein